MRRLPAFRVIAIYCILSFACLNFTRAQTITTIAGTGVYGFAGDGGPATAAQLRHPLHMICDSAGDLLFADWVNHRVRKIDTAGIITTIAGSSASWGSGSGDGGPATAAYLSNPSSIALDAAGNLYISEMSGSIRKVNTSGIISTIAGTGTSGYTGDGGPATAAQLGQIWGVATDARGNIFAADVINHNIRKINRSGIISTIAGTGTAGYSGDSAAATAAELNRPYDIVFDHTGNLIVADQQNNCIRKIDTNGIITTIAGRGTIGLGDGGPATACDFYGPTGLAIDRCGNLYIADQAYQRIRMITYYGTINTIAGSGAYGSDGDGGAASAAKIAAPQGVAVDDSGVVYIADTDSNRIRKVVVRIPCDTTLPTLSTAMVLNEKPLLTVYPNPNNGAFAVRMNINYAATIPATLYDMTGRVIIQFEVWPNKEHTIQIAAAPGTYILILSVDGRRWRQRIIIE